MEGLLGVLVAFRCSTAYTRYVLFCHSLERSSNGPTALLALILEVSAERRVAGLAGCESNFAI